MHECARLKRRSVLRTRIMQCTTFPRVIARFNPININEVSKERCSSRRSSSEPLIKSQERFLAFEKGKTFGLTKKDDNQYSKFFILIIQLLILLNFVKK